MPLAFTAEQSVSAPTLEPRVPPLTADSDASALAREQLRALVRWQRRTLPIMIIVLVSAMLTFLALSFWQGYAVRRDIENAPQLSIAPTLASISCPDTAARDAHAHCLEWKVAALLEQHTINRRYHQANVALLVRVTVKYLGFLTGMLMSLVGAVFILGRLSDPSSTVSAEAAGVKGTIVSASPGLILAFLGTVLMLTTVLTNPPTNVNDGTVYITPLSAAGTK